MAERATDADRELLASLGVETEPVKNVDLNPRQQRIIAGFEEITGFIEKNGRSPQHGGTDIFERLYAVRLDQIRASAECREVLTGRDPGGLLGDAPEIEASDAELLAALGVDDSPEESITELKHVKSTEEKHAAEEIAQRVPCKNFESFKPLFENVQRELDSSIRQTIPFKDNAEVNEDDLFILDGQKAFVLAKGEVTINRYDRPDARLQVIFDNGTESDLLMRSFQRALNKDSRSRRITNPSIGPLFSGEQSEGDVTTGSIYVLRSKSDHPTIVENQSVIHKIGVTTGEIKARLANAKKDPTYLLADVEVVATYHLSNIAPRKLESLLHRFFAGARLDLALKDRFGQDVEPKEWFVVPLPVIGEAIEKVIDDTIIDFSYDLKTAKIVARS